MSIFQKIKLAWQARKLVNDATKEVKTMDGVKPGWQTTEFWGKTVVQGIVLYNSFFHKNLDPQLAVQIVSTIEAIYHGLRALVKAAQGLKAQNKGTPPAASN